MIAVAPLAVAGPHPTLVPLLVLLAVCGALALGLLVMLAIDRGPGPIEVALAYEHAWDRLDFSSLWTLAGHALHDGRSRDAFVRDKRQAYRNDPRLRRLAHDIVVDTTHVDADHRTATVRTCVRLRDGGEVANEISLERSANRWYVVGYRIVERAPDASR